MDLAELATNPQAFDTKLAELHKQHDTIQSAIDAIEHEAHREAGDKRDWHGRRQVWRMSLADALAKAPNANRRREELFASLAPVQAEIRAMGEVYDRTPWPRFFPSITKSHPHIHATLGCRTLHHDTQMSWAPAMSGKTEAEAVAELDEALCSVCFPSAPVALHSYVSRRSQAEQAARAAEQAKRDAVKAAKNLTADEQFRDAHNWMVTTVAGAKKVIRDEIDAKYYYQRTFAEGRHTAAAVRAEQVLLGRGVPAEEIARIRAAKEKAVTRELARR